MLPAYKAGLARHIPVKIKIFPSIPPNKNENIQKLSAAPGKQIQGAFRPLCHVPHDMHIDHRRLNVFMPQQVLHIPYVHPVNKTVAEADAMPENNICPICGDEMIRHNSYCRLLLTNADTVPQ